MDVLYIAYISFPLSIALAAHSSILLWVRNCPELQAGQYRCIGPQLRGWLSTSHSGHPNLLLCRFMFINIAFAGRSHDVISSVPRHVY